MNVNFFFILGIIVGLYVLILSIKYYVSEPPVDEDETYSETNIGKEFKVPENEVYEVKDINLNYYKEKRIFLNRNKRSKIDYSDYNDIQNLSEYNKGTYRDKTGKFKSIKKS